MAGLFITLEGGEGTGKSTQAKRLAERLKSLGHGVVLTREPGGTPQGEALRRIIVSGEVGAWSAAAEAMLMSAARAAHVDHVIAPALKSGKVVISDRFADSTRVYQGFAGGADSALIDALERAATQGLRPDLTLVLDLPPTQGLARANDRGGGEDRFERKAVDFHERLRAGFLKVAQGEPERCKVIVASGTADEVFSRCWAEVEARLYG